MSRKQDSKEDHVEAPVIASTVVSGKWLRANRHKGIHVNDMLFDLIDCLIGHPGNLVEHRGQR